MWALVLGLFELRCVCLCVSHLLLRFSVVAVRTSFGFSLRYFESCAHHMDAQKGLSGGGLNRGKKEGRLLVLC